jgi:hypothetical protein
MLGAMTLFTIGYEGAASCLLCFEREQTACHRDVIAAALVECFPRLVVVPL